MKAMILAAGRGERMRPMTDEIPKPLLTVNGRALIDRHLESLAKAGILDVVINIHYLADQIVAHVGDGKTFGLAVSYSREDILLETAGGIRQALPLLGDGPFAVISSDVYTDYEYALLPGSLGEASGHLVMVDNPAQHPEGDFGIDEQGRLTHGGDRLTYAGIGVFAPRFFEDPVTGPQKLRELLDPAVERRLLKGEHYRGVWSDVGTPERLAALNR